MDYLEILNKLEIFKADMPFHEHLNIKITHLTQTIDTDFDFECRKYITEFKETLKLFLDQYQKTTDIDLKKDLYLIFTEYKENLIKKYLK